MSGVPPGEPARVDLFDSTYRHFTSRVHDAIRKATFGTDIGQNSWLTADEYDRWLPDLGLTPDAHLLEVACGSGGPALHAARVTGCRVTGVDINENGIATARAAAAQAGATARVRFERATADAALPFPERAFDALLCIDSMNHFADRAGVFRDWFRVLRPGGRALFTDPVAITGPVTNDEIARRSAIGLFVFVPPEVTERFIAAAGFRLLRREDATANAALVAGRWRDARAAHRDALVAIEGQSGFDGLQRFFDTVHVLTRERRLSRFAYLVEKP
jgi:ubiquinone/menaquinone biosynthesis C-methylase UbiE